MTFTSTNCEGLLGLVMRRIDVVRVLSVGINHQIASFLVGA